MTEPYIGIFELEDYQPRASESPQVMHEFGGAGKSPGRPGTHSYKVGWTLREGDGKTFIRPRPRKDGSLAGPGFAFHINPQGITRDHTTRTQLQATRKAFYVDNFGSGPTTITIRQLVASGKHNVQGTSELVFTPREHVQRFLAEVYYPAIRSTAPKVRVFFHDNHFERDFAEEVYFPSNALSIQRAVDLHGIWLLQITMISLEKNPYAGEIDTVAPCDPRVGRRYVVKRGDTITRVVTRLISGRRTAEAKRKALTRLYRLNPQLRQNRTVRVKRGNKTVERRVKRGHLLAGEVIRLPCGSVQGG